MIVPPSGLNAGRQRCHLLERRIARGLVHRKGDLLAIWLGDVDRHDLALELAGGAGGEGALVGGPGELVLRLPTDPPHCCAIISAEKPCGTIWYAVGDLGMTGRPPSVPIGAFGFMTSTPAEARPPPVAQT